MYNHILYTKFINIESHKFFDYGIGDAQGIDDSNLLYQLEDNSFPESYIGFKGDGRGDGIRKNSKATELITDYRVCCKFDDGYGDGDFTTYWSSEGYIFSNIGLQSSTWAKHDDEVIYG
jgi:hypothetical protein